MTTAITTKQPVKISRGETSSCGFTQEKIELLKRQIAKGATDDELQMFLMVCNRTGLDPFSRQIYLIRRYDKNSKEKDKKSATIQISIDGFRAIACSHPDYAGQTLPLFCGKDGLWREVWTSNEPPFAAKVGIRRKGYAEPTFALAKWDSYVQKDSNGVTSMWKKFPDLMLAKCAEAQALRKAFPKELSALYTTDEMMQADNLPLQTETEKEKESPEISPAPSSSFGDVRHHPQIVTVEALKAAQPQNKVYDAKGINREIFKKFMGELDCIKVLSSIEEKSVVYKYFSEKSKGVEMSQLNEHLLQLAQEFNNEFDTERWE